MVQTDHDNREEVTPIPPQILKKFYSCTIKSILIGCITAWYGNCSTPEHT
jgi:hypothetical protein